MCKCKVEMKLKYMITTGLWEDENERIRSLFTTLIIMKEIEKQEATELVKHLYIIGDIKGLDITLSEFSMYMFGLV